MNKEKLTKYVKDLAIKRGDFTLSSGKKSTYYLDLKLAYTKPEVLHEIVLGLNEKIKGHEFDRVAGMELGAVPLTVALSLSTGIPFVIIRKAKKGHGADKRIEGEILKRDEILLIEDVVTTGGSLVSAVDALRDSGGECTSAVTVIDRLDGAQETLQKVNIDLQSLLTIKDLGL